jgi:hypothetical protein
VQKRKAHRDTDHADSGAASRADDAPRDARHGPGARQPVKVRLHAGDGFAGIESPDVASASDGATITISATGNFHAASNEASGSGTFVHRAANGTQLASGTFTVTRLTSFDPFGCSVAGGQPIPANVCGGVAVLQVHVIGHPASGGTEEFNAVLTIDCLVGSPPPGAAEGITFDAPGVIDFNSPVSGQTVFVAKHPPR